jgi:hypothetical protein
MLRYLLSIGLLLAGSLWLSLEGPAPQRALARRLRSAPSLSTLAATLVGGSLTSQHVARLLAWEEGGEWEARTRGAPGLSAEQVYEAARPQALAWRPHFRARALPAGGVLQVLVSCNGLDYPTRLDPALLDLVEGLSAHASVNVTLWGPGWPRFEGGVRDHVGENAGRTFGCDAFDVILFRGEGFNAMRCGNSQRAVVVQDLADCPRDCARTFSRQADVILSAHASPLWEIFDIDKRVDMLDKPRLFVHAPHCASARVAAAAGLAPWADRWRASASASAALPAPHAAPPARTAAAPAPARAPATLAYAPASDPALAPARALAAAHAAALAGSALCDLDADSRAFFTRGHAAALMAGCPLRAPPAALGPPGELAQLLLPALVPAGEAAGGGGGERARALRAAYSLLLAREQLTCESRAEALLDAVEAFRGGAVGTHFPHSTSVGCAHYAGQPMPHAWCALK